MSHFHVRELAEMPTQPSVRVHHLTHAWWLSVLGTVITYLFIFCPLHLDTT